MKMKRNPIDKATVKKNLRLWIYTAAAIAVMAAIFALSQQPAKTSGKLSKTVLNAINESGAGFLTPKITLRQARKTTSGGVEKKVSSIVLKGRKWGHVYLYALLGVFVLLTTREHFRLRSILAGRRMRIPVAAGLSAAACLVYACTDEFHQYFVDGRGPSSKDVIFDAIGFCCGIILSLAIAEGVGMIIRRKKESRP